MSKIGDNSLSQTVFRAHEDRGYTKLKNEFLNDNRISDETRGLVARLLSRPTNWNFSIKEIIASGPSGRDKVYRMIKEAEKFGYVLPEKPRHENGTYTAHTYLITDDPQVLIQRAATEIYAIQNTTSGNSGSGSNAHKKLLPEKPEVDKKQPLPEKPDPENQEVAFCRDSQPLPEKPLPAQPDLANPDAYKGKRETKERVVVGSEAKASLPCANWHSHNTETGSASNGEHEGFYANGVGIFGDGWLLPYQKVDEIALRLGIDHEEAHRQALIAAKQWSEKQLVIENPAQRFEDGLRKKQQAKQAIPQQAMEIWNETAKRLGLPIVRAMTPARSKAILARIKEVGGIEGYKAAIDNLEKSDWCKGKNDRGWKADFDFVCQSKSFHRLHEGAYSQKIRKKGI